MIYILGGNHLHEIGNSNEELTLIFLDWDEIRWNKMIQESWIVKKIKNRNVSRLVRKVH